jgi:hypothetical protein
MMFLFVFAALIISAIVFPVMIGKGDHSRKQTLSLAAVVTTTLVYWAWETQASGNIRVDLLLIYPILFFSYILFLWHRFRWLSIVYSLLLMGLNFGFSMMSYSWFHKNPG